MPREYLRGRHADYLLDVIDAVREAILCADIRGTLLFANRSALCLWGYAPPELLGKPVDVLFSPECRGRGCDLLIRETLEKGEAEGEFLFWKKDGGAFLGHVRSALLRGQEGPSDVICAVQDLTEQRRLQRRLLESQKMAFLGKLVDGLAHEIRNPIVTLGGYARRLERTLGPDHPGRPYVGIVLEDVARMEGMLREIEEYLRFARGHRLAFTRLDLQAILREALGRLPLPEGIRLETAFPEDGPWIYGDAAHLTELFHDLLENAVEAMRRGGVLTVELATSGGRALARVRDTGVGIPEKSLQHIYSPFFTTKTKGAGVGLAKAYIIVEEHGGQIEVASEVDQGTAFEVSFPLDRRQRPRREV
jgi:PAS domain S-box-containing protein